MAEQIEGWIFVEGTWFRSPMPPHIAKKIAGRKASRVLVDAEGDPRDRCPDAGPWCAACRREHQAKVDHPCIVCGKPVSILRSVCVGCAMKEQWGWPS